MRVTGPEQRISRALVAGLLERPPASWELDGVVFQVTEVVCNAGEHAWTDHATYEDLLSYHVSRAEQAP